MALRLAWLLDIPDLRLPVICPEYSMHAWLLSRFQYFRHAIGSA
jgi:hypothetical protein